MATRWYDKSQYTRSTLGISILAANTTTQTLIGANTANVGNTSQNLNSANYGYFTDIYALTFYNGSVANSTISITDGTNKFTFGAQGGGLQTTGLMLPVNSPLSATTANTIWT